MIEVKPLETEIFEITSQVEQLQNLSKIKTKELESLQEHKSCPFKIIIEIQYLFSHYIYYNYIYIYYIYI